MALLISGLVIFFAVHSISIVRHDWRNHMAARMGENLWKAAYSLLALLGLVLIVQGYSLARTTPVLLYSPPPGSRYLALLLLLPVFPLLFSAYLPGRIQAVAKQPMLLATMLWAAAHLLVNGTLADVALFGAFLVWAVTDRISMNYRPAVTAPQAPATRVNDILAVVLGLVLYAAFAIWLHAWLFGVPVLTP